jgi:excinuclease ABC subunit C
MQEVGASDIAVSSLAKENEEIYLPGKPNPITLSRSSKGLQLLQRVRDEAHRFALGYHRKVHKRDTFVSVLDGIPGIGPKRKQALLRKFGSVSSMQQTSIEELATTRGITRSLAESIKKQI